MFVFVFVFCCLTLLTLGNPEQEGTATAAAAGADEVPAKPVAEKSAFQEKSEEDKQLIEKCTVSETVGYNPTDCQWEGKDKDWAFGHEPTAAPTPQGYVPPPETAPPTAPVVAAGKTASPTPSPTFLPNDAEVRARTCRCQSDYVICMVKAFNTYDCYATDNIYDLAETVGDLCNSRCGPKELETEPTIAATLAADGAGTLQCCLTLNNKLLKAVPCSSAPKAILSLFIVVLVLFINFL